MYQGFALTGDPVPFYSPIEMDFFGNQFGGHSVMGDMWRLSIDDLVFSVNAPIHLLFPNKWRYEADEISIQKLELNVTNLFKNHPI